ncbi:MAG: DNA translocase FtsK, partial [Clostridia bacterium]|nr:DNA translocase FtsK [Clostridia bacterium]
TGKSVFLNTLLLSLIYKYSPEELRIILVDPKKVELSKFRGMPNLMFNEIFTDNANVCSMLEWAVQEMEERYKILEESGQKNVNEYNEYIGPRGKKMFKILIIIDEFADLMNSSNERKLMENKISRLAAKSRAAGIHLIMATQRPSADIMEGSIKTNFVSRIAFKSASGTDSQVILGEVGAEKLLGRGDMLFKMGNMPTPERAQGCFVDTPEIDAVCKYVKENNECYYDEFALEKILKGAKEEEPVPVQSSGGSGGGGHVGGRIDEDLVKEIMRFAITINNISISGMQRKFSLGFPKAGKMLEVLIERGYVSPIVEGKQRKILMTREQFAETFGEPV